MYYLSGQKQYPGPNKQILTVNDPPDLSLRANFHHQPALIVFGHERVVNIINDPWYQQFDVVNVYTGVLHFHNDVIKQQLKVDFKNLSPEQISEVFNIVINDTKKMLAEIQKSGHNLYMFEFNQDDLYTAIYNNRHPVSTLDNKPVGTLNSRWDDWENVWFKDTSSCFDDNLWDRREKFALIVKKEPYYDILSKLDRSKPHLYYTSDDLWNAMPTFVEEMCHFSGFTPVAERLTKWLDAYKEWRLKHDPWTSRHINRIVDAIVNNHYLSLERFDLDFYKEVLIQHMLITKHNMNLKTWQLEKFPDNAQDLHKLLEPNIHQL
jgi:hypothetical protein